MDEERRVLVLDDDPTAGSYLKDLLDYYGYGVDCSMTMEQALKLLSCNRYDLLLLDTGLGEDEVQPMLEWRRKEHPDLPVIAMSVMADYDELNDWIRQGAVDLLAKPVRPGHLRKALELALETDLSPVDSQSA